MNRRQAENWNLMQDRLMSMGVERQDVDALHRIEMTLSRWGEAGCNGDIQRDGDDGEGAPRRYWQDHLGEHHKGSIVPDRERGALRRLDAFRAKYPRLWFYYQTDPRGCSLYVGKKSELSKRYAGRGTGFTPSNPSAVYSSAGVAVCY